VLNRIDKLRDDYARKMEESALLGIPDYWIVDYLGIGGIAFITPTLPPAPSIDPTNEGRDNS
jgi:Uma2 family endonuclease